MRISGDRNYSFFTFLVSGADPWTPSVKGEISFPNDHVVQNREYVTGTLSFRKTEIRLGSEGSIYAIKITRQLPAGSDKSRFDIPKMRMVFTMFEDRLYYSRRRLLNCGSTG